MDYWIHIGVLAELYLILSISFNLIVGFGGMFSIAHAAFYGIGAYSGALAMDNWGLNFPFAVAFGALVAAVFGLLLGGMALRLSGDYLVIGSFGFQVVVVAVLLNWQSVTRGPMGLIGIPRPNVFGISVRSKLDYFLLIGVLTMVAFETTRRVRHSPFGRSLLAIRDDEVAAASLGRNGPYYRVVVVGLAAAMAGGAGVLYATFLRFISPGQFGIQASIAVLAMVMIGGVGTLYGPVIGAVILVFLPEVLKHLPLASDQVGPMQNVVYGMVLVLVVALRPAGLVALKPHGQSAMWSRVFRFSRRELGHPEEVR